MAEVKSIDVLAEFYQRTVEHVHVHRTFLDHTVGGITHLSGYCFQAPCPVMVKVDTGTLGWVAAYGPDGAVMVDIADQSNPLVQAGCVTARLVRDGAGDRIEVTCRGMETMVFADSVTAEIDHAVIVASAAGAS